MAKPQYIQEITAHLARQSDETLLVSQENRRKIQIQAQDQWAALKNWMRETIQQVGAQLEFDDRSQGNQFKILRKNGFSFDTAMTVTLSTSTGSIMCTGAECGSVTFKAEMRGSSLVYVQDSLIEESSKVAIGDADKLGEKILNIAINYKLGQP